ncbi:MAG: histidine--tRNA ligase [Planctomycetales bacterium 4484_123]|nr:MAG: histidine--tRNA ligase [Planctomycetales bacterium 4484_123]
MEFQAVKGTRDFYPEQMALRNWLTETWRRVSIRNGFVEFDAPIIEYLDLFRVKSGDEIVSQLFSFTDRGGRELALRPEITPTLARMVNARIHSLPRPIKWFSIPRLFRAENPQRGRLREFFQWNVDIIGSGETLADAECIFTAVDLLAEVGLTPQDVAVRIGSRPLTVAALRRVGVQEAGMEAALAALDKRPNLSAEDFARLAAEAGIAPEGLAQLCAFQDAGDLQAAAEALGGGKEVEEETAKLRALMEQLGHMGAGEYCRLDLRIVRGLAYYTGVVYEIHDAGGRLRAIAGGGRYDNLLEVLGGPEVGATGFGMGDVVLTILLAEKHKLPDVSARLDCFVVSAAPGLGPAVLEVVGALRRRGVVADYSFKRTSLSRQLKEANRRRADYAVIVRADGLAVKDLRTGQQREVCREELLADPGRHLS